jgi:hypothetical protein
MQMNETTRRDTLRGIGGGALALLGFAGLGGRVVAAEATPEARGTLEGTYGVVRVRKVKPEYSATELAQEVGDGFVPIVREVPGFVAYFVVADDEHNSWVSIGIFDDKAGADESTKRAAEFGQQGTHDWVDGDPIIVSGFIPAAAP